MKTAIVTLDFFRLKTSTETRNGIKEQYLDISDALKEIEEDHKYDKTTTDKEINGDNTRIHYLKYHTTECLWEIQMIRFREKILPGIVDEKESYELIKLDNNKRIAEFTTLIYDVTNSVILMHRNNNSLYPTGLETYLDKIVDTGENSKLILSPIMIPINTQKIKKASNIYRKFEMGVDLRDLGESLEQKKLFGFLLNFGKINGHRLNITLSLGNAKKDKSLSYNYIEEIIDDFSKNNSVDSLKLAYKVTKESKTEIVDLIENRIRSSNEFQYSKDNPITHDEIFKFFKFDYIQNYREKEFIKLIGKE